MCALQLYGEFGGFSSLACVARQFAWALKRQHSNVTLYGSESLNVHYDNVPFSIAMNSNAEVGIYVGYPTQGTGWLRNHPKRVLVAVCESSPIPPEWVEACNAMHLIVVPSQWCKDVFRHSGVKKPIVVARHGVSNGYCQTAHVTRGGDASQDRCDNQATHASQRTHDNRLGSAIKLLHLTDAGSFPERKGTPQLLLALYKLKKQYPIHLTIKTTSVNVISVVKALELEDRVTVDRQWVSPKDMLHYYKGFDAVVQPSRGEGFGIPPLEARCLGIPVCITNATGHTEHFSKESDCPVEVGPELPFATQGNEYGRCPTVQASDIAHAISDLVENLPDWKVRAQRWAKQYADTWLWDRVLRPVVKTIDDMDDDERISIGAETGLRGV